MMQQSFYNDLKAVERSFPKLTHLISGGEHFLDGTLDICDTEGNYRGSFDVRIHIPASYPYCAPGVMETSTLIPRIDDRHISKDGVCCLDMDHKLQHLAYQGINLKTFIHEKIYPFFANQIFFEENGHFANDEYPHGFPGVVKFYKEEFNLIDPELIIKILSLILDSKKIDPYARCICNSSKRFDKCHLPVLHYLKVLSKDRLTKDLEGFTALRMSMQRA